MVVIEKWPASYESKENKGSLLQSGYKFLSLRIGMSREDGKGSIELLDEHGAGQLM